MKKLEDYTVIELLNMYKEILQPDIENIMCSIFYGDKPNDNKFIQLINEQVEGMIFLGEDKYLKERARIAFEQTVLSFSREKSLNNDQEVKLSMLLNAYIKCRDKMSNKDLKRIENLMLGEKSYAIFRYANNKYKGFYDNLIITKEKQEKLQKITDNEYRNCLKSAIRESISLQEIFSSFKPQYGEDVFGSILSNLYIEFFLEQKRMTRNDFEEIAKNKKFDDIFNEDEDLRREFNEVLLEYLCNNLQYIDKETVLISSVTRVILGIRLFKGEKFEGLELGEIDSDATEEKSVNFVRNVYKQLKKKNWNGDGYRVTYKDKELIRVDMKYIKEFLSRCTQDTYLTDKDIEEIHQDASEGKLTDDIEKRKIAKLNLDDLISANKNYEEKEDESLEKEKILESNIELAQYLLSEEITNKEEILDCFMQGNINLELISNIGIEELTEEFFNDKFRNLYFEMVFAQESDEANKTLNKFSTLYSRLLKNNKITVNEDELIDDLVSVLGNEFAAEILSDLYDLGVVTIEKGIEWVGTDILFEEYKRGNLKPGEVRKLYEDKIINLDGIANVINKLSENGDKFMIIGSIFPEETDEDRDTRDLLIDECLKIDSGVGNGKVGNGRKNGENKTNDYYKHITDPFARISLIKALDKDYSFEMTSDGHAIVKLPNLGKVIIEKMLDRKREPSYGAATYILDKEYYEANSFRIIRDGKINRQEIIKDINSKQVERVVHQVDSWGESIRDYLGKQPKTKWNNEDIQTINEAIERVKRSEKIVGEKKEENRTNLARQCDDKQLAKMILNLIVTRKATIEQVEKIAEIYGVDLGKVMDSLDER